MVMKPHDETILLDLLLCMILMLHIAKSNDQLCGAKRPGCGLEHPAKPYAAKGPLHELHMIGYGNRLSTSIFLAVIVIAPKRGKSKPLLR